MPGSPRDDSTAWGCPAWWEAESSHLDAEAARRPGPLPGGAQAAQPFHQHRVRGKGLGTVEQRVEHLVVAGGGHVEQLTDGLLLGARELPPLPFEGEDGSVALRQLAGDRRGTGQCPRYLHRQLPHLARAWETYTAVILARTADRLRQESRNSSRALARGHGDRPRVR